MVAIGCGAPLLGVALIIIGIGFNLAFGVEYLVDAVGTAYEDYQNGEFGLDNAAQLTLGVLSVVGGSYTATRSLRTAARGIAPSNTLGNGHTIGNSDMMYRKAKGDSYIEPMPKKQLRRIIKAFEKQGGTIQMNDATDAYLISKKAEAITLNENTILLRQNPGRASVFEELIHATQFRQGLNDGSTISRIQNEIAAQEMLLRNSKAYKLTTAEIKQTQSALASYIAELEKLTRGN